MSPPPYLNRRSLKVGAVPAATPVLVAAEVSAAVMEAVLPVVGLALPSPVLVRALSSAEVSVLVPPPACRPVPPPELLVGVGDVALELILIGLAQDGLLVGLR
jgi:hypothetical protein